MGLTTVQRDCAACDYVRRPFITDDSIKRRKGLQREGTANIKHSLMRQFFCRAVWRYCYMAMHSSVCN